MYLSYLFLSRYTAELNELISGMEVKSLHTQEKNKLVMSLANKTDAKYIEFSCEPSFIYLNVRENFHRAGKNSVDFIEEFLPSKIKSVNISSGDRVIRFDCGTLVIYFLIRGRFSNILMVHENGGAVTFKNMKEDAKLKILSELDKSTFTPDGFKSIVQPSRDYNDFSEVKNDFPFFSKDISELSPYKLSLTERVQSSVIQRVILDFREFNFSMIPSPAGRNRIVPDNWMLAPNSEVQNQTAVRVVDQLIRNNYSSAFSAGLKERINTYLDRELNKIDKSVSALTARMAIGDQSDKFRLYGSMILNNLGNVKRGMKSTQLFDFDGKQIEIPLKESLSAKENADRYFEKARDEKRSHEKNEELLHNYQIKREKINELLKLTASVNDNSEIEKIAMKLKIKMENTAKEKNETAGKFREYLIDETYRLYVGKDSINNDLLTLHFAKKEDLWFHARSVPGSHVVLRVEGDYKEIPKSVIKTAAAVAAWYSKSKTAGLSPVAFTQKKYVVKRKGMEPGKVMLMKEQVIIVKPEIPKNCKPVNDNII